MTSILFVVSEQNFKAGTGIHTYVTDLCNSLEPDLFKLRILVIKTESSYSEQSNDLFYLNANDVNLPSKILAITETYAIKICHFHSMLDVKSHLKLVKKLKKATLKIILTIHNNSVICLKGNMAFNNKNFCKNNTSDQRCVRCLSNRHRLGGLVFVFNILNKYLKFSTSKSLNYFGSLNKFKEDIFDFLSQLDSIIILDNWVLDFLPKNINRTNVICIPQAIKADENISIGKFALNTDIKRVAYLGRTDITKGLLSLVLAMKGLSNISLDCYVEITDRKYFEKILNIVKKHKLNIHFFPQVPHSFVAQVMLKYDLICLPSYSEMAPLLSLEALSVGVPVLASDHPAFISQSLKNVGLSTFENGNVNSLRRALKSFNFDQPLLQTSYLENVSKHANLYQTITN